MKNKIIKIIFILFIIIISLYVIMLIDTNNLKTDFEDCILDKTTSIAVKNSELYRYYNRKELYDNNISYVDADIRRLFVIHNFHTGVIYVSYFCQTFDDKGKMVYSSPDSHAKWYIKKKHGRWIVYDVDEKP